MGKVNFKEFNMIKYVENKSINFKSLEDILKDSENLNQYTNKGPAKHKLEDFLKDYLKISSDKSVVCFANGTLALHSLMLLYQRSFGKKIKIAAPSFTFPSCKVGGFNSSILDIDLDSYTIPLSEELVNKYDGFIITTLFGTYPKNIKKWQSLCKKHKKILIFDNASSPLSYVGEDNICNMGDASFGSLHHTKFLGFGEGGFAVVDKEYEATMNEIAGFGFGASVIRKYNKLSSNFKISDVSSACILQHIKDFDLEKYKKSQSKLIDIVNKFEGVSVFNNNEGVVFGNLPIVFDDVKKADVSRFRSLGVEAQKYYRPLVSFKNSNTLYKKIINLPIHSSFSEYHFSLIERVLKSIILE